MNCMDCGQQTRNGDRCRQCVLDDRYAEPRDRDWAECPDCGGITSGQDVVCADCRRVEA